jgi:hypothetical protein
MSMPAHAQPTPLPDKPMLRPGMVRVRPGRGMGWAWTGHTLGSSWAELGIGCSGHGLGYA